MHKYARKVMVTIGTGALLVGLVGTMSGTSSAANLTGGNYTYVVNGEEYSFPFDPVKVSSGVLLPVEVFQKFGIDVQDPLSRTVTLSRSEVTDKVTLGTTTYELNGRPDASDAAPLRLNGRLFVSANLLKDFGVDYSQDGNFVIMRDFTSGMPTSTTMTSSDFNSMRMKRFFTGSVKADSGIYLYSEFTLLNPGLLAATNIGLDYGTRARLQSIMQSNSLVLVKFSNSSVKSGKVNPSDFVLVDEQRRQYDLVTSLDAGDGSISARLAPAADRMGILVFPKVSGTASMLTLFYEPNGANVGTFTEIH
jgi:hypothetical protein